jgi:hypothetical protein
MKRAKLLLAAPLLLVLILTFNILQGVVEWMETLRAEWKE